MIKRRLPLHHKKQVLVQNKNRKKASRPEPNQPAIILFNKPYHVLCQFTDEHHRKNLSHFINDSHFYAAGRLDYDSEGLLLLTNSGRLQHRIQHPTSQTWKHYWVQVEGEITEEALQLLRQGILLSDGLTLPAKAINIDEPNLWQRQPPIRDRKQIPTSWVDIALQEGKNRQVRRMLAHTGFPVLRLVRHKIENWQLNMLQPGEFIRYDGTF